MRITQPLAACASCIATVHPPLVLPLHCFQLFFFFYLPQATRHHRLARAQKKFSDIFFTKKLQRKSTWKILSNKTKHTVQLVEHVVAAA